MIVLGIVLFVIGWIIHSGILEDIGGVLVIVGVILWFLPSGGEGPRRRYY